MIKSKSPFCSFSRSFLSTENPSKCEKVKTCIQQNEIKFVIIKKIMRVF